MMKSLRGCPARLAHKVFALSASTRPGRQGFCRISGETETVLASCTPEESALSLSRALGTSIPCLHRQTTSAEPDGLSLFESVRCTIRETAIVQHPSSYESNWLADASPLANHEQLRTSCPGSALVLPPATSSKHLSPESELNSRHDSDPRANGFLKAVPSLANPSAPSWPPLVLGPLPHGTDSNRFPSGLSLWSSRNQENFRRETPGRNQGTFRITQPLSTNQVDFRLVAQSSLFQLQLRKFGSASRPDISKPEASCESRQASTVKEEENLKEGNTLADDTVRGKGSDAGEELIGLSRALTSGREDNNALPIADAQRLFSSFTTAELANALLNLEMASNDRVVDAATAVLSSPRLLKWKTVAAPLLWTVKKTAHAHFCAGETVEEACHTLERMWALGLKGILDFSVEDALDEATCDRNLLGFLQTIGHTSSLPSSSVSFACVKLTALCPLPVLEHASTLIRLHHYQTNQNKAQSTEGHQTPPPPTWMLPSLPVLSDPTRFHTLDLQEGSTPSPSHSSESQGGNSAPLHAPGTKGNGIAPLSEDEIKSFHAAYERLRKICKACELQGVPLLVDAEYQSVEPAVDHLAYAAAVEFNKGGPNGLPLVYATVQCYLQDALPRLKQSLEAAQRMGVPFGVKLVRGAYLSRENQVAKSHGLPSPLFERIEDTHACYDECAELMIDAAAVAARDPSKPQAAVVLATHNHNSGRKAVLCAEKQGMDRKDPRLHFAQLKGMADVLSLTLALSGFNVSKYLPYGKVEEVIPYLLRRAQENRGVLGNTTVERNRLWTELKRRLFGT